jgi:ketosteroid isomerase-like protein
MKPVPFLVALAAGAISAHAVRAQQGEAVRTAIERHYAAIHAQDMPTVMEHHRPDFTWFGSDGRLLLEAGTAETADAQIYGDVAVATFYLVGTHAWGGEIKNGMWRVTAVWVREGGEWKEAHHHESPLMSEIHP